MKIIAICNQKGGVGKTTTTVNVAAGLQSKGKKALCIDFDPQCHLSLYLGHIPDDAPTIADLVLGAATGQPMPDPAGLIHRSACGVDYIPASLRLSKADLVLAQALFRERILSGILSCLPLAAYDYVLIDCNPSMGVLMTNAMFAADGILIPVQTEDFSMDGLRDMLALIDMVRAGGRPQLEIIGILPTMLTHTKLSGDVLRALREQYGEHCFSRGIWRSIDAAKSVRAKQPLIDTKSKLAGQYMACVEEILQKEAKQ